MLLWIDGFDSYGTSVGSAPSPAGIVGRKYPTMANESSIDVQTGRLSGYALKMGLNQYFGVGSLTTNATVVAGFAIKFNSTLSTNGPFFNLFDGSQRGVHLNILDTGEISVYNDTTLLGTTSGLGIVTGAWHYIELKVKCANSGGTYELRVGGVNVLSSGSADTRSGSHDYHDGFRVTGYTSYYFEIDDLYFLDGSGSVNNTFLGNRRVVTIRPDEAGDSAQFTPDSGSNYARVNEAVCGDDSNYVEDSTSGHKDLYGYGELLNFSADIAGIQINTDCRETDATSFSLKTVCLSGVTEDADAGQSIGSTTYVTKRRIMETDPDTVAAWLADDLDAAQFGIKVA